MDFRVTNYTTFSNIFATCFELGFHQSDQLGTRPDKLERRFEDLRQRNEASVANDDVDRLRNLVGGQEARIGLLVDDNPRVLPKLPRQLISADVDRVDLGRTARQQDVRKATGRRPDIERHRAAHVEAEVRQPVIELDTSA